MMTDDLSQFRTHSSLLVRIRDSRDAEAWQAFTEVYTPLVYGYCRRHGLQEADAADVAQEVLVRVARSIKSFDYDAARGRFRDWLGTTVRNELARYMRRSQRGKFAPQEMERLETTESDPEWVDQFHAHLLEIALRRIQSDFEPATWQAFEQVWLNSVAPAQAAANLNQPIDRIYVAKSRVLKRLKAELAILAEDLPFARDGRAGQ